jgi:transposase
MHGIEAMVRSGARPIEVKRKFGICLEALLIIRRRMGMLRDFRYKPPVPNDVRERVIELLPTHSCRQIQAMLTLSNKDVRKIAASVGGSAVMKLSGPGRRVRGAARQEILEHLRNGMSPGEVRRRFKLSAVTIQKMRIEIGDTRDRRKDLSLTGVQVEEIRAVLAGHTMTWKGLAQKYGVSLSTIGSVFRFEKGYRDDKKGPESLRTSGNHNDEPGGRPPERDRKSTEPRRSHSPQIPTAIELGDTDQCIAASGD